MNCSCKRRLMLALVKFNSTLASHHEVVSVKTTTVITEPVSNIPWTDKFVFVTPDNYTKWPMYKVLDKKGKMISSSQDPQLGLETYLKMYKCMLLWNTMDKILFEAQRQGRISFYINSFGEEATHVGSAAALSDNDWVYSQYRESGVLLYRGFELKDFINQCLGNCEDYCSGRHSPVCYGLKKLNFVTISPPLATQMPQAVGTAYALKRAKRGDCVIVYFGEGAASEGDAHAAFNFAATLDCPVIFFCRNNGYSISTPTREQYRGDGIVARAEGYGIRAVRVDGNDVMAVYNATKAARQYAIMENKPVILEAMTYRVGHHSTSDDSSAYRAAKEVEDWRQDNPITRFRLFLESRDLWDSQQEQQFVANAKKQVLETLLESEKKPKPEWKKMFSDVYCEMPEHITKQMNHMENHLKTYKDKYPQKGFKPC